MNTIPVILYHSVADNNTGHPWSFLSLSIAVFEKQMQYLLRNGFRTIGLSEFYKIIKDGNLVPEKTVVLTFDDGFLDNWVFVYPVLQKYGLKGNIFVNPQCVDPDKGLRKTLKDVWDNSLEQKDLSWWGYASWDELRKMAEDKVMEIHSHGMTHGWYFSGSNIVDFHHPKDPYYWLEWNLYPEEKPFWLSPENNKNKKYGYPVYEFKEGLVVRRYKDDQGLADLLTKYVTSHGGVDFFNKNKWKKELHDVAADYKNKHTISDCYETHEEYIKRVLWELIECRREIERQIGIPTHFFCWPNGAFNEEVHKIAVEEAGYLATIAVGEYPEPTHYDNLIGRIGFSQAYYKGPFPDYAYYLKFISAVESRNGSGVRCHLIRYFQKLKKYKGKFCK